MRKLNKGNFNLKFHSVMSKKLKGFNGITHILSALAIFMLIFLFKVPQFKQYIALVSQNYIFLIIVFLVVVGASLLPDLDNDVSTANSRLGIFGKIIYLGMVTIASIIFSLTQMKNDKPPESMHRLFWHTPFVAGLMGFLFWTSIESSSSKFFPLAKRAYENGNIGSFAIKHMGATVCIIVSFICVYLAVAIAAYWIFKFLPFLPKFGRTIVTIAGSAFSIWFIMSLSFTELKYIGLSIALGYGFHLVGDFLSQGSVPIIWPIPAFWCGQWWYRPWILGPLQIRTGGIVNRILDFSLFGADIFLVYLLFIK